MTPLRQQFGLQRYGTQGATTTSSNEYPSSEFLVESKASFNGGEHPSTVDFDEGILPQQRRPLTNTQTTPSMINVPVLTVLFLLAAVAVREGQGQQCADTATRCQPGPQCFVPATQRTCRQTCKTCDCQDYASNCADFAYLCGNATYEEALRTRCQVTCGFCSGCEFQANGIVPKYMQLAPSRRLDVTFETGAKVDCGNTLTLEQQEGMNPPTVNFDGQANALYTFIMMGPQFDGTTGMATNNVSLHWLVVNIPGNNLAGGRTLEHYQRAVPFPNTGLQPYVFAIYRQAGRLADENFPSRENFNATVLASARNLGYPYAGNYFRMQLQ